MRAAIRKMGNSSGIIIPKPILNQIGGKVGDNVDMTVEDGKLVLAPAKRHPREGWAEASKRIAAAGEDALVWPEFANDDDTDWTW